MEISKYITLEQACYSVTAKRKGINNQPGEKEIIAMKLLCTKIYDVICKTYATTVDFNSFFRSVKLNKAIGGSSSSQHCKGEAIDLDDDYVGNKVLFNYIKNNLIFDQLIWEFGDDKNPDWVHVSYKSKGNRNQILKSYKENGVTKYKTI